MNTQSIQWYLDIFPWRRGDEYMWRWSATSEIGTVTATATETETETATEMEMATAAETETYFELWSHRPLVDGIRLAQ